MNLRHQRAHAGVSLVESLVALVVISIGMLGIAALHVESLRTSRTAILRTQAVTLAAAIADQIRANREQPDAYADAKITSADVDSDCLPGGAGCTPEELAHHDKATWLVDIAARLPGGTGSVKVDTTTVPVTYEIAVNWTEQGGDQSYTLRMGA